MDAWSIGRDGVRCPVAAQAAGTAKHTTAANHRQLAQEARAKAAEHEAMWQELQAAGVNPKVNWQAHCEAIANMYRQIAEQHDTMARDLQQ